jgi:hypothetical protein
VLTTDASPPSATSVVSLQALEQAESSHTSTFVEACTQAGSTTSDWHAFKAAALAVATPPGQTHAM